MRTINIRKLLEPALHLIFWMISINAWYFVFNPGVESTAIIKGLQDYWPDLILLNILFYLYCLMPFVWFIKNARKWLKIFVSFLFLIPVGYLLFQLLLPKAKQEDISLFTDLFMGGFMYVVVFHLTIATAVYFNLKVLANNYLKVSRFGTYLFLVITLIVIAAVVNFALFNYCIDPIFPNLYFISYYEIWEQVVIVGAYLLFTTIIFLVWQYATMLIANRDKAQHELLSLKAQINPHFLFNNLNTIYSMASKNDERTKEVILQLSDFLRYVLYDTASEFIPLEKEVEIIKTYIELQKSRIDPNITTVDFTFEGNFRNRQIAPLLLLPLAENCFKHGVGKKQGKIQLYIGIEGNKLLFATENSIVMREPTGEVKNGGIGINNVGKRLNLLYPNHHSLYFEGKEGVFKLEMKIDL